MCSRELNSFSVDGVGGGRHRRQKVERRHLTSHDVTGDTGAPFEPHSACPKSRPHYSLKVLLTDTFMSMSMSTHTFLHSSPLRLVVVSCTALQGERVTWP